MSWFLLPDDRREMSSYAPRVVARPSERHRSHHSVLPITSRSIVRQAPALGSAQAAETWNWAQPERAYPLAQDTQVRPLPAAIPTPSSDRSVALRVPATVLRRMAAAAQACGRSEGDIWAEAAEEWLSRYALDDEPQPPTPAAAALSIPRPARCWGAIDALLADLRVSEIAQPEPELSAA